MKRIGLVSLFISFAFFVLSFSLSSYAQTEQIEIVTYYPAPYGVYQTLRVSGELSRLNSTCFGIGIAKGTHINLGWNSTTGIDSESSTHCTISGGGSNTASKYYSTVGGGEGNQAITRDWTTVGGGQTNTASGLCAIVGGGRNNLASDQFTTVGGGILNLATNQHATIAGGTHNEARGVNATIGGGYFNQAIASDATIGGGNDNIASNLYATICGGKSNRAPSIYSFVGGGENNEASWNYATVAGGHGNTSNGNGATIGGGQNNSANEEESTISGGSDNTTSSNWATVGGGINNTASGVSSTVPGGSNNTASGIRAFAAGRRAKATHNGSFVWADNTDADYTSTGNNRFHVRASGGSYFVGSATLGSVMIAPNESSSDDDSELLLAEDDNGTYGMRLRYDGGDNRLYIHGIRNGNVYGPHITIERGESSNANTYVGIRVVNPTHLLHLLGGAYCDGGAWVAGSSRDYKKDIAPLKPSDHREMLEKLKKIDVVRYRYKNPMEDQRLRIGMISEDSPEEFVASDRKGICTLDAVGFIISAFKAQNEEIEVLKKEIDKLKKEIKNLEETGKS